MKQKIIKWLKARNEYSLLIYAFGIWVSYPFIARVFDPTTVSLDPIYIQLNLYAAVGLCISVTFTWIVIKAIWPGFCTYFETEFTNDFKELEKWQKIVISLFLYCFFVWVMVMLSQNILIK